MAEYTSTCIADHHRTFRGLFARLRNRLWWIRHDYCKEARRG